MALKAVNMVPGTSSAPISPTDPVLASARSDSDQIPTGTISAVLGFSGIVKGTAVPEDDESLLGKIRSLGFVASERRIPEIGSASVSMSSGALVINKTSNSPNEKCVYEVVSEVPPQASSLAYFRVKLDSSWQEQSPDWLNLDHVLCPYLGLEIGQKNTAVYLFFRKVSGVGSLVLGGPLQAFHTNRPGQTSISYDWASLPSGSYLDIWIFVNTSGYGSIGLPTVQVWAKAESDSGPSEIASAYLSDFGKFMPDSTSFYNSRPGPLDRSSLFMGNIGLTGDSLSILDWALFPDFRKAVEGGEPAPSHLLTITPDLPGSYDVSTRKTGLEGLPFRWFPLPGGAAPIEKVVVPGWSNKPSHLQITRSSSYTTGLQREEPILETRADGFSVEAFMSANITRPIDGKVFGCGIGVDDGSKRYQVVAVEEPTRTLGITKTTSLEGDTPSLTLVQSGVDWRSRKLVRLTLDRHRDELSLSVDGATVLSQQASLLTVPNSYDGKGRVYFGHLSSVDERGDLNVQFLRYLQRYKAWEASDGLEPQSSPISTSDLPPFSLDYSGDGSTDPISSGVMVIRKTTSNSGSKRVYKKPQSLSEEYGLQLEFSSSLQWYRGPTGAALETNMWSGVGARVAFGTKALTLGFFSCGPYGNVVGIIPGNGSISDIVGQTPLGRKYSAVHDWTQQTDYRIVYTPWDAIRVYIGTTVLPPAIVIPWSSDSSGFNLPDDPSSPAVSFGHYDESTSSVSSWKYFRWGYGSGHDIAITQKFPLGTSPYHFGGKALSMIGFDV